MKIRNQWIVDDRGDVLYMTLREWIKALELKPIDNYLLKTNLRGKTATVYFGGYGVKWEDLEVYSDYLFFVGNADLRSMSINHKYW